MRLRKRLTGSLAVVALSAALIAPLAAGSGVAAASSRYVVASVPLRNLSTGEAEWYYGYVQLWYDTGTGRNWARVVSLVGGTTSNYAEVERSDGAWGAAEWTGAWYGGPSSNDYGPPMCGESLGEVCSATVYSPVLTDSAYGDVFANGVTYQAQTGWY
jgi:hypothetical protein